MQSDRFDWTPTKEERELTAATLAGYLDAAASVDGEFREYTMTCRLVALDDGPRDAFVLSDVNVSSGRPWKKIEFRKANRWTEVEGFFRSVFLRAPFGVAVEGDRAELARRRFEMAFQASDLVMFLARDMEPGDTYHFVFEREESVVMKGCLVEFSEDAVLIIWVHNPKRVPLWNVDLDEDQKP